MRAVVGVFSIAAILATVGVLGYPVVARIPKISLAEIAAWSWTAGLVLLAFAEGSLLLFHLSPDPWKIWGLMAIFSLALRDRRPRLHRPRAPSTALGRIVWTVAGIALVLYAIEAVSEPMWAWDFFAIWGLKGKTLYLSHSLPARFFHDRQLAFSHPDYPLMLPTLFAGLADLLGSWDTRAMALLYPGIELATLLVSWGFLRRRCGASGAAAALALTAGFATLYQTFLTGLAEIPIALGFVLAATAVVEVFESEAALEWRPLAIAALFCSGLKTEGSVFVLLLAVVAGIDGVSNRRRRSSQAAAALAGVALAHRASLRLLRGPTAEWSFRLWPAGELSHRLWSTGSFLFHHIVLPGLPALLAVSVIFAITRPDATDRLLPALGALAALYAVAPAFSTWSDAGLMASRSVPRIVSALVPAFLLVLGSRISGVIMGFSLRFRRERPTMN